MSSRLSLRETVSCCPPVLAWPRRSNVSPTQPSATISRARARYCCWLPPQPWTKSTPGRVVAGVMSVPAMCSRSTRRSNVWSRVDIPGQGRVLGEEAHCRIDTAEIERRPRGDRLVLAIHLGGRGVDGGKRRVGAERFQRGDLRRARSTETPRLLEHAAARAPFGVAAGRDVVIAAGGEEAREARVGGGIVRARMLDR